MEPAQVFAMTSLVVGCLLGVLGAIAVQKARLRGAKVASARLLSEARQDAERVKQSAVVQAEMDRLDKLTAADAEMAEARSELKEGERRLKKREDALDRKADIVEKKEEYLERSEAKLIEKQQAVDERQDELDLLLLEQQEALATTAGLSHEEAHKLLLAQIADDLAQEEQARHTKMIERVTERSDEKARWIISEAIQRVASEHTTEHTTATINLPSEDMKGRVIGREGRNIRTFEKATGCDLIVDDTPGIVVVSSFDAVRREVGRRAMCKLVEDGRIHPARIEATVVQTQADIDKTIDERGAQVPFDVDIHGIHPRLLSLLGRLQFRASYGQNVLLHSIECAHIAGIIAGELKCDVKLAKRSALLHDIGKALDQDQEGGHPELGLDIARKCKEPDEVLDAIANHHDTANAKTVYAVIASAADAISASRPGARRESMERYVKRLERLEEIATSVDGVHHAYALQAGREVRVIVDQARVDDSEAAGIARRIAKDIEDELTYPGEVRVTLIRETRVVEYAR